MIPLKLILGYEYKELKPWLFTSILCIDHMGIKETVYVWRLEDFVAILL